MAAIYLQPNVRHIVHQHHEGPAADVISTPGEAHQTNGSQVVDDMSKEILHNERKWKPLSKSGYFPVTGRENNNGTSNLHLRVLTFSMIDICVYMHYVYMYACMYVYIMDVYMYACTEHLSFDYNFWYSFHGSIHYILRFREVFFFFWRYLWATMYPLEMATSAFNSKSI